MQVIQTPLAGLVHLIPQRFGDTRGFFAETWNRRQLARLGIELDFVQDNHSFSMVRGTVRGLHFQAPPHAQAKLVRCGRGSLFDVAVDIRKGSPTFGQWYGTELSFQNGHQLLVPAGFLHGFATLEADTEIVYKCSAFYAPQCEGSVRWNDPDIDIDWKLGAIAPTLSDKDSNAPLLQDFVSPFDWKGDKT